MSAAAVATDDARLSAAAAAAADGFSKSPGVFAPSSAAMAHLEAKASSWSAKIQSISTECISPCVEAAWRREKDGCQLSAYLGVSHKASSTSLGQQAEGSACSGTAACTGSVLALDSAEVAWSFLCIDTGRGSLVSILDGVCACMLDGEL